MNHSDQGNGNVYVIMKQDNTFAKVTFTIMTPVEKHMGSDVGKKKGDSEHSHS